MTVAGTAMPGVNGRSQDRVFSFLAALIVWVMFIIMSVPGNMDFFWTGNVNGSEANPVTRTLWICMFAIGIAILLLRISLTVRLIRQVNVFLWLFIGLATVSIIWSIDPQQTGVRLFRLYAMSTALLAIAAGGWNLRRFQELVRPPVTFLLAASIVFCLANPAAAIHHEPNPELINAWHGVFPTKNSLGAVAAFGFIVWSHAWLTRETGRARALLGACIAAVCLVKSRSSTSTIATVLSVMALLLLMRTPGSMRRSVRYLSTALILVILLYSLAMLKLIPGSDIILSPIPLITGKSLTFSNRSDIWAAVLEHVRLRPLLGSGYSAYWTVAVPSPYMESYSIMAKLNGFYPGSAHNGYLQVLNDLGAVGLACLLGYIAVFFRQSIRLYVMNRGQGALFLGLLLQQATINLSEPLWLNTEVIDFAMMTMATTCLARILLEARMQLASGSKSAAPTNDQLPRPEQLRPSRPGRAWKSAPRRRYPFRP